MSKILQSMADKRMTFTGRVKRFIEDAKNGGQFVYLANVRDETGLMVTHYLWLDLPETAEELDIEKQDRVSFNAKLAEYDPEKADSSAIGEIGTYKKNPYDFYSLNRPRFKDLKIPEERLVEEEEAPEAQSDAFAAYDSHSFYGYRLTGDDVLQVEGLSVTIKHGKRRGEPYAYIVYKGEGDLIQWKIVPARFNDAGGPEVLRLYRRRTDGRRGVASEGEEVPASMDGLQDLVSYIRDHEA